MRINGGFIRLTDDCKIHFDVIDLVSCHSNRVSRVIWRWSLPPSPIANAENIIVIIINDDGNVLAGSGDGDGHDEDQFTRANNINKWYTQITTFFGFVLGDNVIFVVHFYFIFARQHKLWLRLRLYIIVSFVDCFSQYGRLMRRTSELENGTASERLNEWKSVNRVVSGTLLCPGVHFRHRRTLTRQRCN